MKITKDSHVHVSVSLATTALVLQRFAGRTAFFVETFEVDDEQGLSALYGPQAGDAAVTEDDPGVFYARRDERACRSRMVARPSRMTGVLTVIAGPYKGEFIVYAMFWGTAGHKEDGPGSAEFWAEHALSVDSVDQLSDVYCPAR